MIALWMWCRTMRMHALHDAIQAGARRSPCGWQRHAGRIACLAVTALSLSGCEAIQYYAQAVGGHLNLMAARQPLDTARHAAEVRGDQRLSRQLALASRIRVFATQRLGLPDNGSYRQYADLHRPFAVWNVFAAPALSLKLKEWCFPVAGCVTYRGYYDRDAALAYAATLRAEGWDIQVAGIPAYSTLGFFDDPLLNTFIYLPEGELARLIFHELAHQVVYVQNDTAFNESFASAVEQAGVELWLREQASPEARAVYERYAMRRVQFRHLLLDTRAALEALYRDDTLSVANKQQRKHDLLAALQRDYQTLRTEWGGYTGYDRWFDQPLSNAHLAAVASYEAWVPAFRAMLAREGNDFSAFFAEVRRLARLEPVARAAALRGLSASR